MNKFIAFIYTILCSFSFSQELCLSPKVIENQITKAANPQSVIDELEALKSRQFIPSKAGNIISIPIVFHIIHNGDNVGENENISDSIILEQLNRINTDFRAHNLDTANILNEFKNLKADTEITFCLAKKDTSGNFTNGIIRHNLGQTGWNENDLNNTVKTSTIWDRDNYLNVWICNFEGNLASNNVNGYATPPFSSTDFNKDGVVLNYTKVGNDLANNTGRTLVHEVGHWLGLFHIWGDDNGACTGDDGISDTPNQADAYYNCPSGTSNSCGSNDMYNNYMDYTDANCSLMFTIDQKNKMLSVLNGFRISLLSSMACTTSKDIIIEEIIYPNGTICQEFIQPTLKIKNIGEDTIFDFGFKFYVDDILKSEISNNQDNPFIAPNHSAYVKSDILQLDNLPHLAKFILNPIPLEYNLNNEVTTSFNTVNTGKGLGSLSHNFEDTSTFLDFTSYLENPDFDTTWNLYLTNNNNCILINNNSSTLGNTDNFVSTDYQLYFLDDNISISFDYLYRVNQNLYDTLTLYYSLDCGLHWVPIWQKQGLNLSNNENANYPFIYTNEIFNSAEIYLAPIFKQSLEIDKVRFKFENKSGGGNNLYLDNIRFNHNLPIKEVSFSSIKVFPNPAKDVINITQKNNDLLNIQIYSISGQEINKSTFSTNQKAFPIQELTSGFYFIKISNSEGSFVQKFLKN